ncbi:hypothetical protein JYQ62_12400 [Nostoc sp. UHCC 0702]|nr:hypothetical protein JYQ62_34155 [Nostoc sp. UHCC 0702]QSJ19442.1 hypothetical protein JYQ62_12400 [Nostoc sp. UHCC 0702]
MITQNAPNTSDLTQFHKTESLSGNPKLIPVSESEPCRHCGKPDWCYRIGELEVCKRDKLAEGWHKTSKHDGQGTYYLAPTVNRQKQPRPKQTRFFNYQSRDGKELVRVVRTDDGTGKKKIWQEHYQDGTWVKGLGNVKREDIPLYNYWAVSVAHAAKCPVFVVEGEACADALRKLGIISTTNIGGSGKWTDTDSADLRNAIKGNELILCPDMDKPGVKHFLNIYKRHPDAKVLLPYPDSPLWDKLPESEGLDVADWIEEYHPGKDEILKSIMDITPEFIERLERQFNNTQPTEIVDETEITELDTSIIGNNSKSKKSPPADIIATEIAKHYQDKLIYDDVKGCWMSYGLEQPGVWQAITNATTESIIAKELDSREIVGYGSHKYVKDIIDKLRCIFIQRKWNEAPASDYLPFQNKVLNLKTREVIEHSPEFRFTWCLPREYDENAKDWSLIESWLDEVTGSNQEFKNIIVCFCNAVLKGRYELQKFLLTTGHGGTGKTTLQNLIVELIGERNVHTTSLSDFCGNRFETANAYGKRLVIFPDEDKYSGNLEHFKDLTGKGRLRIERKGKDADQSYQYMGMVMMASNYPVFVGEQSSAIQRRIITVPFTQTPQKVDHQLFEKLTSQLNAFTNYLLSLSDEFVTETLSGTQKSAGVSFMEWEQRMMTDSVAWWLNEFVIRDSNIKTQIGNNKNEAKDNGIANVTTLYGSYYQRCSDAGKTPKSNTEFSRHLKDLCNNILGWKEVEKHEGNRFNELIGLRLRKIGEDDHIPTVEEEYADKLEGLPSTPSTFQTQQAFEPSTAPSTIPSTIPSTGHGGGGTDSDSPAFITPEWRVEGKVEDGVEGQVEGSKPYQIRKVEGVEDERVFSTSIFDLPSFDKGDIVSYTGTRHASLLAGLILEVVECTGGQYCCKKPDGYYTTWLDVDELMIVENGKHRS